MFYNSWIAKKIKWDIFDRFKNQRKGTKKEKLQKVKEKSNAVRGSPCDLIGSAAQDIKVKAGRKSRNLWFQNASSKAHCLVWHHLVMLFLNTLRSFDLMKHLKFSLYRQDIFNCMDNLFSVRPKLAKLWSVKKDMPILPRSPLMIDILNIHEDVIRWKHFPRYWPFVRGIHRSPVNSPHKGQWEIWCFLGLCLNKRLSKQSGRRWFEMPSRALWRHCGNVLKNARGPYPW